jgi:hypothetical protein
VGFLTWSPYAWPDSAAPAAQTGGSRVGSQSVTGPQREGLIAASLAAGATQSSLNSSLTAIPIVHRTGWRIRLHGRHV